MYSNSRNSKVDEILRWILEQFKVKGVGVFGFPSNQIFFSFFSLGPTSPLNTKFIFLKFKEKNSVFSN